MDGLIAYALAKKYTDKVGQDIISAGFKVQVEEDRSILNRQGAEKVLYLLPKEYGSSQDGYDEFVYANNNWEWVGKTDVSLDYELLSNKPQINGHAIIGNITLQDLDIQKAGNYFFTVDNKVIPYNFNQVPIDSAKASSTLIFSSIKKASNIPSKIREKIFGNMWIFHYNVLIGNAAAYTIRKVIGYDTNLHCREFIQHCAFDSSDGSIDTIDYDWVELTGGGAQIVSGVVNVNGTITFTDSEGNSFTTSGESVIGADGFSPSATVQQTASGATISITDSTGTTTANITNGQDGNDYVLTTQDKSDIADIVLSELPTTQGVLYGNQSN